MKKHYHNIGLYLCVSRLTLVQKNVTVLFPQEGRCEEFVRMLTRFFICERLGSFLKLMIDVI